MMSTIEVDFICHTSGNGYWTTHRQPVKIWALTLSEDQQELRAHHQLGDDLALGSWSSARGWIYTDPRWIADLRWNLQQMGFSQETVNTDLCYSEFGMQRSNYVSFDVGTEFIREWHNLSLIRYTQGQEPLKFIDSEDNHQYAKTQ